MFAPPYEEIQQRWIDSVRREIPLLLEWWSDLLRRSSDEVALVRARWPAGPASHPTIIALFRRYYFEVHSMNEAPSAMDDGIADLWGSEAETRSVEASKEGPVPAVTLLLASLAEVAPDVAEFLRTFDFLPIGEDPDFEVC